MPVVEGFLTALERNWEMVDGTLAGLDDQTLARRPTEQCNSIAWLLWHMTRVVDTFIHTRLQAQPQIWIRDGWHTKFGMEAVPEPRTVAAALGQMTWDNVAHGGQIAYLRGLFQGMGWYDR